MHILAGTNIATSSVGFINSSSTLIYDLFLDLSSEHHSYLKYEPPASND